MAGVIGCSSTKILEYSVEKFSSYLSNYIPENIQENKPGDQTSRWSSDSNNPPQFLLLKLQQCAITDSITFGKYEKTHVCNLKKFKVFGGLQESNMVELLEGGLKNDSTPETFNLKHEVEGYQLPCRYIKIVPLQSWGPSFNFSVWFVEVRGRDDPAVVQPSVQFFYEYREREAIRLCLKHFRQRGASLLPVFEALQSCTGVILEDPRLSALHNTLVVHADYSGAEAFMEQAVQDGLLDQYLRGQDYSPVWSRILSIPNSDDEDLSLRHPGMRGGHQMCMDPHTDTIFLFGGWDGTQDLSDFWQYHVPTSQWTKLSNNTEAQGGPSARSCHKMCLDPDRRQIFTLGRYLDTQYRSPEKVKSDFYVYDIERRQWTLITEDTAAVGGPQLIFDHQMCMDHEHSTIYVFGGRVLTPTPGVADEQRPGCVSALVGNFGSTGGPVSHTTGAVINSDTVFSGLYAFHVATSTWSKLCEDSEVPVSLAATGVSSPVIRSRVGHSMLFHPGLRELFIFAGQRNREYLNDFFSFNVDTHQVRIIWDGGNGCISAKSKDSSPNVPATGYTQRATIDPELNEIYVLSGLSKDKEKRDDNVQNSFWVYYINQNYWSCIYRNENTGEQYWNKMQFVEPCPRFAHQLVYNQVNKTHYLFGGNPGKPRPPKLRLDDFWQLKLCRPSKSQLLQRCRLMIRRHRFKELAAQNSLDALNYLQTTLSEIIDHSDLEQTREFQLLTSELFRDHDMQDLNIDNFDLNHHQDRSHLFDELSAFFPDTLTQPRANLVDVLPL